MKELPFRTRLFYFFPVIFCFSLPFGSFVVSWLIVGWTFVSFFNLEKSLFLKGLNGSALRVFWLFFLLTLLSAIFSVNKKEALFSIEVKMSFFIFPYLLFCFRWPPAILRRSVISFVSGCFFASIYLLGRAFIHALNGQPEYFFYTLFSDLLHASYFSMYLLLALVFVFTLYPGWFRHQKSIIYGSYFFAIIFIAAILFCASKIGLITLLICLPALIISRLRQKWTPIKILSLGLLLIAIFIIFFYSVPGISDRIQNLANFDAAHVDKGATESTAVRFLIWQECLQIIQNNFWMGTGVGDANDALYQAYEKQGLTGAFNHKLNAHNQYFQTFIGLGIAGFLLLIYMTLGYLVAAIRKRKLLLSFFSFIILVNFLVESMLQTSAGVVFFTFFCCFFHLADHRELAAADMTEGLTE